MRVMIDQHDLVVPYVSDATGHQYTRVCGSIGIVSDSGRLMGGILLTDYTGHGVDMTIAGRGCLNSDVWFIVGECVFGKLGCERLSITTARSNKMVRRLAPKVGFRYEGIARRYYGTEDGIVFSMIRTDPAVSTHWSAKRLDEHSLAA